MIYLILCTVIVILSYLYLREKRYFKNLMKIKESIADELERLTGFCKTCGCRYPEADLITDNEYRGLICKNCAIARKMLDDEQRETESMRRDHDPR